MSIRCCLSVNTVPSLPASPCQPGTQAIAFAKPVVPSPCFDRDRHASPFIRTLVNMQSWLTLCRARYQWICFCTSTKCLAGQYHFLPVWAAAAEQADVRPHARDHAALLYFTSGTVCQQFAQSCVQDHPAGRIIVCSYQAGLRKNWQAGFTRRSQRRLGGTVCFGKMRAAFVGSKCGLYRPDPAID